MREAVRNSPVRPALREQLAPRVACETPSLSITDAERGQCCVDSEAETPRGFRGYMSKSLDSTQLVGPLLVQAFATGVLDATTYADFETFASNQTGNTLLLTLAAIGTFPVEIVLTSVSLGGFVLFAFAFGQIGHMLGIRRRSWLLFSHFVQILLLVIAAILVYESQGKIEIGHANDWVIILLFATSSGAQVAMARTSGVNSIPTAMLTSPLTDLITDKNLFKSWRHPSCKERNRRIIYIVTIVGGAFVGAALHKHMGTGPVILLTVAVKLVVLGLLLLP